MAEWSIERFRLPRWFARDGINAAVLDAMWRALCATAPDAAVAMLYLGQAAGKHLDRHGAIYGVTRLLDETDNEYRARIIAELRNPRCTPDAIARVVRESFPNVDVTIATAHEITWGEGVRFFDGGWYFNGDYAFTEPVFTADATDYARFFVDIVGDVDLVRVRAVIERVRAAGYIPIVRLTQVFVAPLELPTTATVQRHDHYYVNGLRRFDGTWNFSDNTTSPEEPLA